MKRTKPYDLLAALLRYPGDGYRAAVADCLSELEGYHEHAARLIAAFAREIQPLNDADLEELFTRTFDLNPVCCLEVGWHLYGEDYKRGNFMVNVRQELRRLGIEETTELPDHLVHVLPALARMEEDQSASLIRDFVLPALEKMREGMGKQANPYEHVIEAIHFLLTAPQGVSAARREDA